MFARAIATAHSDAPARYKQGFEEIPSGGKAAKVTDRIASRINELVDERRLEAVALTLPGIKDIDRLAEILLALDGHPNWSVTASDLLHPTAGELVAIHMNLHIPFKNTRCPSEPLVVGPFDIFPNTRRAPVTAFEIFVGEPREFDPKTNEPTTKANLAHIEMNLGNHAAFEKMWARSMEMRLESLGGQEDPRAKAKVAFVLSKSVAAKYGYGT